jgi:transposase
MGKPHPQELRERVVAFVKEGHSHREAARHFRVSPRFVNNMMLLYQRTGSLAAKRQGYAPGKAKLIAHQGWLEERLAENGEMTLDELRAELAEQGVNVHRATVGRFLNNMNYSNKKNTSRK